METTEKKGLTSFAIKVIAIVTMFIDHCGAVFVERRLSIIKCSLFESKALVASSRIR